MGFPGSGAAARRLGRLRAGLARQRFDLTGPVISHHLKVLREAGIIDGERRGTWGYYRVLPATPQRLSSVLTTAEQTVPGGHATLPTLPSWFFPARTEPWWSA